MPPDEPAECNEVRAMREERCTRTPEQRIGDVLDEEDRVIERGRVLGAGLSKDQIHRRVKRGSLYRKQRGAYTAGHGEVPARGAWRAAVAVIGDDAFVDGAAALALWDVREFGEEDVLRIACRRHVRHRRGVRVTWDPSLPVADTSLRHGIRVVMPARALLGYAATERDHRRLRRVVNEALVKRRVSIPQLIEVLARSKGKRGAARLARALADAKPTRSELEDAAVAALHAAGLHDFVTNQKVAGREVDVLFADARLIIELDSRFHDTPLARADDAAKDARLEAAGYEVIRLRWRDLTTGLHQTIPLLLDRVQRFSR